MPYEKGMHIVHTKEFKTFAPPDSLDCDAAKRAWQVTGGLKKPGWYSINERGACNLDGDPGCAAAAFAPNMYAGATKAHGAATRCHMDWRCRGGADVETVDAARAQGAKVALSPDAGCREDTATAWAKASWPSPAHRDAGLAFESTAAALAMFEDTLGQLQASRLGTRLAVATPEYARYMHRP